MIYHCNNDKILNKGLETAVLCLLESIPIWGCPALYIAVNYSVRIALKKNQNTLPVPKHMTKEMCVAAQGIGAQNKPGWMGLQAAQYNLLLQWGQPWGPCAGLWSIRSWTSLRTEPAQPLWATHSTAGPGKKCLLVSEEDPWHFWKVYDYSTQLIEIFIVNCDVSSYATVYFRCSVTAGKYQHRPQKQSCCSIYQLKKTSLGC